MKGKVDTTVNYANCLLLVAAKYACPVAERLVHAKKNVDVILSERYCRVHPHPGTVLSGFGDHLARDQDCGHK